MRALNFPRDHGSHPDLRTEWWYITGHALAAGKPWGFQVTFFRSRVEGTASLRSAFAAQQLLFAHAALTDVQGQKLHHDQRIARAGFAIAQASTTDTALRLQDWTLHRTPLASPNGPASRYTTHVGGGAFSLDLQCDSTQSLLLQGQQGLSRKGPDTTQASYYYSQPQLEVSGSITLNGQRMALEPARDRFTNRAWLDHEWSESLLHPEAVGWDWMGINLNEGGALTAFRLRRSDGSTLYAGGSVRRPGQAVQVFGPQEVVFTPLRLWTSPASGARYPVAWGLHTPAGRFTLRALVDAQELDSQASTGTLYWEGLSELSTEDGWGIGRGYLEMTGYARPLRL
ncbi:MAG: carotenoid 1,2-hydratase [Burkholderiaceae bacterium]|nr:carotenoid 1,2-hydratase [Burkholderiaceae bacterium]